MKTNQPKPLGRSLLVMLIVIIIAFLSSCTATQLARYDDVTRPSTDQYYIIEIDYPYILVSGVNEEGERYTKYMYSRRSDLEVGGFLFCEK